MMYKSNMAIAIKVAGKVLREFKDTVYIPFGSEYAIHLKNLHTRRAKVKISIDGEDVLNGTDIVVGANESIDLERFVKDLNKGNRFKFIERTPNIEKNRGLKAEDGLVQVEFAFEKEKPIMYPAPRRLGGVYYPYPDPNTSYWCGQPVSAYNVTTTSVLTNVVNSCLRSADASAKYTTDVGITAPGSISDQTFYTVSNFDTDASEVIVLRLIGDTGQAKIIAPVTVKSKPTCVSCGRKNKFNAKFCTECGTSLIII